MENLNFEEITVIIYGFITFAWIIVRLTPSKKDDKILKTAETILKMFMPVFLEKILPNIEKEK